MSKKPKSDKGEISLETMRRFEATGVPLSLVEELFEQIHLPENLRIGFWQGADERAPECLPGKVLSIKTECNGKVTVTIGSTAEGGAPADGDEIGLESYFYAPRELTKDQLDELKRAQSGRLCVKVCFEKGENGRVVQSIEVFECPKKK